MYDLWNQKSIGGCTYYASHSGGRNYNTYPFNAYEAESRRERRFFNFGHTQGNTQPNTETANQESDSTSYRYMDNWYSSTIENVPLIKPQVDKKFPYSFDLRRMRN